jgi:hypothetical protein
MKKFIVLLLLSTLFSCIQKENKVVMTQSNPEVQIKKNQPNDAENQEFYKKPDTLTKNSKSFNLNNLECYWKLTFISHKKFTGGTGIMELKNYKNNKTLLTNEDYYDWSFYDTFETYALNKDDFMDVNFDGYKDYVIQIRENSGSAGDFYNVYIFQKKDNLFQLSKELSNYGFELDTINRTVTNYYKQGHDFNIATVSYYKKNGKLKYVETTKREILHNNDELLLKTTFTKSIGKKVIKQTIDTINFEGY